MSFSKGLKTVDTITRVFRKCQLMIKDAPKVKAVLDQYQADKAEVIEHLGPKTKSRNRFKKIEG